jgi:hypothetical protein
MPTTQIISNAAFGDWSFVAAQTAITSTVISAFALLILHWLSPEFAPSWRMVSEYANGKYRWVLSLVFFSWALSSVALCVALWPVTSTTLGKIGIGFLMLAVVGQIMGGLFDINHKLHSPAAMIGIPSLCIAAVILNLTLRSQIGVAAPPAWSSHLPWISFALMVGAFVLFFASLKAAGIDVAAQTSPFQELPSGVTGYVGWANRLLFLTSYLWVILASVSVLKVAGRATTAL